NPYLALGGLLAAGLDGVDRGLDPGEPLDVNPSDLGAEGLAARGLVQYPDSLLGVLRAFEDDHRLIDALGPTLAAVVLGVRRAEWEAFGTLAPAEVALRHFTRY